MEFFGIIVLIAIVFIGFLANTQSKTDKLKKLKETYSHALKGTDKRAALEAGRAYYSSLRKGKTLTIYDEQAITNDLSTMAVENNVVLKAQYQS